MPEEPEGNTNRPMHDLVDAYTQARRKSAEGAGELHPATRRLLQGEVKRQYPSSARLTSRATGTWWRRMATAFGMVCLLSATAYIVFHPSRTGPLPVQIAKQDAQPVLSADPNRSLADATTRPARAPGAAPDLGHRLVCPLRNHPPLPVPPRSAQKREPRGLAARALIPRLPPEQLAQSARARFRTDIAPPARSYGAAAPAVDSVAQLRERETTVACVLRTVTNSSGVLTQFDFEQSGERVRVVDGDGLCMKARFSPARLRTL